MGFDRAGLGLQYGNQGIDAYGIRNTPHGRTLATMEVKSTRTPSKQGTEKEVLRLLNIDSKGLQQGSRLYGDDRIRTALRRGSPVAANIRSGQARAGDGRIWQVRHYVHWKNVATGEEKTFRAISNKAGNRVSKIQLIPDIQRSLK